MSKAYVATRAFKDAGTEREFSKGALPEDVTAGEIKNYLAAGLIEVAPAPEPAADADKPAPKSKAASKAN